MLKSGYKNIAVVGAGWAGIAAAVDACRNGHQVTLIEASRTLGGRARALPRRAHPDPAAGDSFLTLDNGQHILLGGYAQTLRLMDALNIDLDAAFLRLPLDLRDAQGMGMHLPDMQRPWNLLAGLAMARGWSLSDKRALLTQMRAWRKSGFLCAPARSVADICSGLPQAVRQTLMEPLCVSALNTLPFQASGQVFLRVLHDALMGEAGKSTPASIATSDVLLPLSDLSRLMPEPAARWLERNGATVLRQHRVARVAWNAGRWDLEDADGERHTFDAVIWATAPENALQIIRHSTEGAPPNVAAHFARWCAVAEKLRYESIATVYTYSSEAKLPRPLLRLNHAPGAPAQFVVDRGVMGDPGLWAFVISAARGEKTMLEFQVLHQARTELADYLSPDGISIVQTVIEKRATFACNVGLKRPGPRIAPGLLACGDYTYAPYPATLEGAVRSGQMAAMAVEDMGGFKWKD